MTVAISKAVEEGATAVICASTGNTSASAAAYAAKAGIACVVLVPHGRIAAGKLAQALVHGARLLQVEGGFDDCLRLAREPGRRASRCRWSTRSTPTGSRARRRRRSRSSTRSAGRPTCTACRSATPATSPPTGRATPSTPATAAAARRGCGASRPRAPRRSCRGEPVADPETIATAIRIGNPASWAGAVAARDESGGRIDAVTDREILDAQRLLSTREGVFVEPASAASVAGLLQCHARGLLDPGLLVVCTVTGNGLKDTETAPARDRRRHRRRCPPTSGPRPRCSASSPHEPGRTVPRTVTVRVAGHQRQPRPGLRLPRARAGPARRRRRHRRRPADGDRVDVTVTGEGAGVVPVDDAAPGRPRRARRRRTRSVDPRGPLSLRLHQPDPARPRPRLVGGRRGRRPAGRSGPGRRAVPERLTDDAVLALASELEGHPDNAAACLLGGLTLAWADGRRACTRSALEPRPDLRATVLVPSTELATETARGLLPARCRTPTRRTPPAGPRCSWRR